MVPGIDLKDRSVVFPDVSTGCSFLARSTISTKRKIKWEDAQRVFPQEPM